MLLKLFILGKKLFITAGPVRIVKSTNNATSDWMADENSVVYPLQFVNDSLPLKYRTVNVADNPTSKILVRYVS